MRAGWLLLALVAAVSCTRESQPDAECRAQAAELRTWLGRALDRTRPLEPPWPTGDPATDARIEKARAIGRAAMRPRDPDRATRPLSPGVRPGLLEHELAQCPPALAQLARVGQVPPAQSHATFAGIADAIASCGCRVNIPYVKALVYGSFRGLD
jgi:hypothetical protein